MSQEGQFWYVGSMEMDDERSATCGWCFLELRVSEERQTLDNKGSDWSTMRFCIAACW